MGTPGCLAYSRASLRSRTSGGSLHPTSSSLHQLTWNTLRRRANFTSEGQDGARGPTLRGIVGGVQGIQEGLHNQGQILGTVVCTRPP